METVRRASVFDQFVAKKSAPVGGGQHLELDVFIRKPQKEKAALDNRLLDHRPVFSADERSVVGGFKAVRQKNGPNIAASRRIEPAVCPHLQVLKSGLAGILGLHQRVQPDKIETGKQTRSLHRLIVVTGGKITC